MQEWKSSTSTAFITLTYATPHLTWLGGKPQLVKADLQKWFKRVRKAGYRIRYFAVGEYGEQTMRPHFHVLLFGYVPEDVIRSTWSLGQVHIGQISYASCGYCTKYVISGKWKGTPIIEPKYGKMINGRTVPFAVMSRGRGKLKGIGSSYLTPEMIKWHKAKYTDDWGFVGHELRNYMMTPEGKRHLPRYYKDKIFSKIDKVRIANRSLRDAIERERKELYRLRRIPDAQKYVEKRRLELAKQIKDKAKTKIYQL